MSSLDQYFNDYRECVALNFSRRYNDAESRSDVHETGTVTTGSDQMDVPASRGTELLGEQNG